MGLDKWDAGLKPAKQTPKSKEAAAEKAKVESSNTKYTILAVLFGLKALSMIFAWYIAWNCFASDLKMIRVFKTMLCMGFSEFYIFYFFVTSVLMDMPCH